MLRSRAQARRLEAWKGTPWPVLTLRHAPTHFRFFRTAAARALLRMRTDARAASRLVTEPFSHYLIHHFKQPTSFPRRIFCAGGLHHCFAHPDRGVGGAPRDVRVFARHPLGTPYCVKDARERAYDAACQALARRLASHDAGRSPLGAPPWRVWAPRAALLSPAPPPLALRPASGSVTASSSHPGRSAWRATSLPPQAPGYAPQPQDATPRSAFRIVSGDAPQ